MFPILANLQKGILFSNATLQVLFYDRNMFPDVKLSALYDENINFTVKIKTNVVNPKNRFERRWSYNIAGEKSPWRLRAPADCDIGNNRTRK